MFCPQKNSYLQLVCAINPKLLNRAVSYALHPCHGKENSDWTADCHLVSMQPSLYAPQVDITRAKVGFGRVGLRILNRDLHSADHLTQLQALHSIMDRVQISEDAMFLINLNVVHRLMSIMHNSHPVIREIVCKTLDHLAKYHQGKQRILAEHKIIEGLLFLIVRDRKEIRYAAAKTLTALANDSCDAEKLCKTPNIIEDLLTVIRHDHKNIIVFVLEVLEVLIEHDPETALKANAFQLFLKLFYNDDNKVLAAAMKCMMQLCKHPVGLEIADENEIIVKLREFLKASKMKVVIACVGVMMYATLTVRAKWRAREFIDELIKRLVILSRRTNRPILQLRAMQCLINLCDHPDIRNWLKEHWEYDILDITIKTPGQWDGHTKAKSSAPEFGHHYRTVYIEGKETFCNDIGDYVDTVNVHSYLKQIQEAKKRLTDAIYWKPDRL